MRTKSFIQVLIALFVAFTFSCSAKKDLGSTDAQVLEQQEQEPLAKSLIWTVEGKNLKKPSYVFGTIHIMPSEDYFLPNGTEAAMKSSDKVVFEIDMKDMMDLGKQLGLLTKAVMKDGVRLRDLLSPEDYTFVKEFFDDMGIPFFMLEKMKPMFLSMFAQADIGPDDMANGSIVSYEMEFFQQAQVNDIAVSGLETMEYQMSMFDSIPYKAQAEMLVESIRSSDVGDDQFKEMIDVYKSQDIEAMYAMINGDESEIGPYEDLLLTNRNRNWIPHMETFMQEGVTFFAVGAGHLAGPQGIIPLLREAGYNVKPMTVGPDIKTSKKF